MAIPFFDEIEKLINEHGSATILRERMALANDRYAALEEKLAACTELNTKLRSKTESQDREIAELKARLEKTDLRDKPERELDETQEKILTILANSPPRTQGGRSAITLGISAPLMEYHLTELANLRLVSAVHNYSGLPTTYSLTHPGRAHLMKRGLLK